MTLEDKFEELSFDMPSEDCVQIADEFAIGFAIFLAEHTYSYYNDKDEWSNDFGHKNLTNKELLEIYKKEKGL
jgi:hypothetical protein